MNDHVNIQEAARRTVAVIPPPSSPNNDTLADMEKQVSQLEGKCGGKKLRVYTFEVLSFQKFVKCIFSCFFLVVRLA